MPCSRVERNLVLINSVNRLKQICFVGKIVSCLVLLATKKPDGCKCKSAPLRLVA